MNFLESAIYSGNQKMPDSYVNQNYPKTTPWGNIDLPKQEDGDKPTGDLSADSIKFLTNHIVSVEIPNYIATLDLSAEERAYMLNDVNKISELIKSKEIIIPQNLVDPVLREIESNGIAPINSEIFSGDNAEGKEYFYTGQKDEENYTDTNETIKAIVDLDPDSNNVIDISLDTITDTNEIVKTVVDLNPDSDISINLSSALAVGNDIEVNYKSDASNVVVTPTDTIPKELMSSLYENVNNIDGILDKEFIPESEDGNAYILNLIDGKNISSESFDIIYDNQNVESTSESQFNNKSLKTNVLVQPGIKGNYGKAPDVDLSEIYSGNFVNVDRFMSMDQSSLSKIDEITYLNTNMGEEYASEITDGGVLYGIAHYPSANDSTVSPEPKDNLITYNFVTGKSDKTTELITGDHIIKVNVDGTPDISGIGDLHTAITSLELPASDPIIGEDDKIHIIKSGYDVTNKKDDGGYITSNLGNSNFNTKGVLKLLYNAQDYGLNANESGGGILNQDTTDFTSSENASDYWGNVGGGVLDSLIDNITDKALGGGPVVYNMIENPNDTGLAWDWLLQRGTTDGYGIADNKLLNASAGYKAPEMTFNPFAITFANTFAKPIPNQMASLGANSLTGVVDDILQKVEDTVGQFSIPFASNLNVMRMLSWGKMIGASSITPAINIDGTGVYIPAITDTSTIAPLPNMSVDEYNESYRNEVIFSNTNQQLRDIAKFESQWKQDESRWYMRHQTQASSEFVDAIEVATDFINSSGLSFTTANNEYEENIAMIPIGFSDYVDDPTDTLVSNMLEIDEESKSNKLLKSLAKKVSDISNSFNGVVNRKAALRYAMARLNLFHPIGIEYTLTDKGTIKSYVAVGKAYQSLSNYEETNADYVDWATNFGIRPSDNTLGNLSRVFNEDESSNLVEWSVGNKDKHTIEVIGAKGYTDGNDSLKRFDRDYKLWTKEKKERTISNMDMGSSVVGKNLFDIKPRNRYEQLPNMTRYRNLRAALCENNDINIGSNFYWFAYITIPHTDDILGKEGNGKYKKELEKPKIFDFSKSNGIVPDLPYNGFFPILSFTMQDGVSNYMAVPLQNGGAFAIFDGMAPVTELSLQVMDNDDWDVTQWLLAYRAQIYSDRMSSTRNDKDAGAYVGDFDTDWRIRSARESYINVNIFWCNSGWRVIRHKQYACIPNFNSIPLDGVEEKGPRTLNIQMNVIGTYWPDNYQSPTNDFKDVSGDNTANEKADIMYNHVI